MRSAWFAAIAAAGAGLLLASRKTAGVHQAQRVPFISLPSFISDNRDYADMYADIRGLRNNNPGNIRIGADWQGRSENQSDPSFVVFKSPEWGIRALGKVLINYEKLYGLNTVEGIISRWAPTDENDTASYIKAVARSLGVQVNQVINVREQLLPLSKAIIHHENGIQPYSDALLNQGLALV